LAIERPTTVGFEWNVMVMVAPGLNPAPDKVTRAPRCRTRGDSESGGAADEMPGVDAVGGRVEVVDVDVGLTPTSWGGGAGTVVGDDRVTGLDVGVDLVPTTTGA
jgi:hypothetical protein